MRAQAGAMRYFPSMLVSRCWILPAAAFLAACGSGTYLPDASRDGWSYDTSYDVVLRRDTSAADAVDVSPTVDVIAFDGSAADVPSDSTQVPADATANPCTALAEDYARTVRDAQICLAAADCSAVVCETLCCSCQVYVNGHSTLLDMLTTLQSQWTMRGCTEASTCTPYVCGGIVSTDCTSAGRCATVHRGD